MAPAESHSVTDTDADVSKMVDADARATGVKGAVFARAEIEPKMKLAEFRVSDDAISSVALGAIERLVRALENGRGVVIDRIEGRKPDRDRHLDVPGALRDRERFGGDAPEIGRAHV